MQRPTSPTDALPAPVSWHRYADSLRYVAAGGIAGAVARWGLLLAVGPTWAAQTVVGINGAGSLILGVLIGLRHTRRGHQRISTNVFLLLGGGFCGAFTTFSTYAVQVARALDEGNLGRAAAIAFATAGVAVLGAGIGYRVGSRR